MTRRPGRIVLAALLLGTVAVLVGGRVARSLKPFGFDDPASQSVIARDALELAGGVDPDVSVVALVRPGRDVRTAAARTAVERVAATIRRDSAVARVLTVYETHNRAMISSDGRATYVVAFFRPLSDEERDDAAKRLEERLSGDPQVTVGGSAVAFQEVGGVVSHDLARAELLAFPILFLLAFWVFRGVIAAALPPLVGGFTIVLCFLALRIVSEVAPLSIFALNLITGLGLGLAIDWSLLVLSRYREEAARAPSREAVRRTLVTAGRTVLFSSLTVAAALASLLVFPQRFLYSMGVGGVLVALIGGAVTLVVLPAVLVLLGPRVNALAPRRWQRPDSARPATTGAWYRFSRLVMRYPGRIAAGSAAALILLGIPFLGIEFTTADARVLPKSSSARRVDDALRAEFPPNRASPLYLAIAAPRESGEPVAAFAAKLRTLPGVAGVGTPQPVAPGSWKLDVISSSDYLSDRSQQLVRDIRALPAPFDVKVGGDSAWFVDQKASLAAHLPLALALVVVTTMIVLFLMTGSIVLPVKALVMNALTVSAAFGLLVFIFQDGRLEGLLGYTSQGALEFTQPILLFAIVFALSTDYGVFLLSRIKEAREGGADDAEAVALGLERTGRIVTAAALLFCVAIGAFSTSRIVFIKELGLGTAAAVVIDATIVRALLVPSLMKLLGGLNWWAPAPLRRLHARLGLREGEAAAGPGLPE